MIIYTQGNLLEAQADALVNTVNTVGVMGKGIALMFKERFAKNMSEYAKACKAKEVRTGEMYITETGELMGPRWIVNFPTKQHWRSPSKMEWIVEGLQDLRHFILENKVSSVAIPPLGAGNGGLPWDAVRQEIENSLSDLDDVKILIYEPTSKYQNVAKKQGVKTLTPARALIAELIRRYWVLGMECSLLEIQKLAWFLDRTINKEAINNPLDLRFEAHKYGPYSDRLRHLLEGLDGSYLHCDKRIADADPLEVIWFDDSKKEYLQTYLKNKEAKPYAEVLEHTAKVIDGFESPFGMELLSTVDWLIQEDGCEPTLEGIKSGLHRWKGGERSANRKTELFDEQSIEIALKRLQPA
ncbi:Appr-1-p processing protein [Motiliproteus sp. MSK22-1]|nr:Appr-1-p processing protein [Motiliproteus sp. MSK22-1]